MSKEIIEVIKLDAFVKSPITSFLVIPAKAGIQEKQALLDPGFRRGDGVFSVIPAKAGIQFFH